MGGNNQVQQDTLILKQQRAINHKALTQSYYYSHSLTLIDTIIDTHWHTDALSLTVTISDTASW